MGIKKIFKGKAADWGINLELKLLKLKLKLKKASKPSDYLNILFTELLGGSKSGLSTIKKIVSLQKSAKEFFGSLFKNKKSDITNQAVSNELTETKINLLDWRILTGVAAFLFSIILIGSFLLLNNRHQSEIEELKRQNDILAAKSAELEQITKKEATPNNIITENKTKIPKEIAEQKVNSDTTNKKSMACDIHSGTDVTKALKNCINQFNSN